MSEDTLKLTVEISRDDSGMLDIIINPEKYSGYMYSAKFREDSYWDHIGNFLRGAVSKHIRLHFGASP